MANSKNIDKIVLSNDELNKLIIEAQNGDLNSREHIIKTNLGLIKSVMRRFITDKRVIEKDDIEKLFMAGLRGLNKAISKFDIDFNVRFSTYAVPMILGEMKRFLRERSKNAVSEEIRDIIGDKKLDINIFDIKNDKNLRDMSIANITDYLVNRLIEKKVIDKVEYDKKELLKSVIVGFEKAMSTVIKEQDLYEIALIEILKFFKVRDANNVIEDTEFNVDDELTERIKLSLKTDFDEREVKIIYLIYFMEKSHDEVAEILNISKEQVSQLNKDLLLRMKKSLNQ